MINDKKLVRRKKLVYSSNYRFNPEQLISARTTVAETLPENLKDLIFFEIDTQFFEYDPETYHALFMFWDDYETDDEVATRINKEAAIKAIQEERDRLEFERLQKKFSQ